jgi:transcriptional regulator with PAS, ATPase and Fis domain
MYLRRLEERFVRRALLKHRGNKTLAARTLGIGRTALIEKCRKFGLMNYGGLDEQK